MLILDGKKAASFRHVQLTDKIKDYKRRKGRPPGLGVVLVGNDPGSQVYVRNKEKASEAAGIKSIRHDIDESATQSQVLELIGRLNAMSDIDGILVQLPLPQQIRPDAVLDALEPSKDSDGLTAMNLGLLWAGRPRVKPCTPAGVMAMLAFYNISIEGCRAVVVGRSQIVGKPMAQLLLDAQATITICHSKTQDLKAHTKDADLVVVAAGCARMLGREHFKKGAIIVDVGVHRLENGKLCGDVRYEELDGWAEAATPVPGGVGPMTVQMLLENTLTLAERRP